MASEKSKDSTTVYYNSACPVCDAGIRDQRLRMQACNINWVDIHTQPDAVSDINSELEAVRERLHLRRANGEILIGEQALAELWSHTNGRHSIAWLTLRLGFLTRPLYNFIARYLYRWNRRRGHW
ncbi:thiol-disulfide oxidoreductase DCC family protein [Undibacterium sp. Di27W]|uniref:thiol-disulfide oxidoreductase DCC family protein n=1 Tax=Undibacterium sp. Di27W TaxID=3413036 RepID=UPI003BF0EB5B